MVGHLLLVILKVHTSQHPSTVPQQFRQTDTETEYRVSQHPSVVPQQFRQTDTETEYRVSQHPSVVSQQFRLTDRHWDRVENITTSLSCSTAIQADRHWDRVQIIRTSLNCFTAIQADRQSTKNNKHPSTVSQQFRLTDRALKHYNIPQLFHSNSDWQTEYRVSQYPSTVWQQFMWTDREQSITSLTCFTFTAIQADRVQSNELTETESWDHGNESNTLLHQYSTQHPKPSGCS